MGEYGLSTVLLANGFNLGTLMSRYRSSVDWRQVRWQNNRGMTVRNALFGPVLSTTPAQALNLGLLTGVAPVQALVVVLPKIDNSLEHLVLTS